jgi:hypothetical protein
MFVHFASVQTVSTGSRSEQESSRSSETVSTKRKNSKSKQDSALAWGLDWLLLLALVSLFNHLSRQGLSRGYFRVITQVEQMNMQIH